MPDCHTLFRVGELYSNDDIFRSLGVGNAGGVRVSTTLDGEVSRLVIFTSLPTARQLAENPYHDRMEGDILIYTGAGREGNQTASGVNARIAQQDQSPFPIYGFVQVGSRRDPSVGKNRWAFLGLLQYVRGYREQQLDSRGDLRNVLVFELRVHATPAEVHVETDKQAMSEVVASFPRDDRLDDCDVVTPDSEGTTPFDLTRLEPIRRQLLAYDPREFEHLIHDLLQQSGFEEIVVTKYSQDGGIDLNARPGKRSWPLRHLLVQLQAKRWLHTVGRKEVAELRGSLQPHAAGCIVTTSHFSRAAIFESTATGKVPILVIDGYELANVVAELNLRLT